MILDYHMHLEKDTHLSQCRYTPERIALYVERAKAGGAAEIGITEHCNRFEAFRPAMEGLVQSIPEDDLIGAWLARTFTEDLEAYVEAILAARRAGLPVKASIEVDYIPGMEEEIRKVLDAYPFDYVLGSVHFLGSWAIDVDPGYGWPEKDVDAVYTEYFATLSAAARSGLFDVLAHPDLVKKFGHRPSFPLDEVYDETARVAREAGVAVEISTAGLHRPVAELYPSLSMIEHFRRHGVPITLGSDAHQPEHVARDLDKAVQAAVQAGYETVTVFDAGRPRQVPIG